MSRTRRFVLVATAVTGALLAIAIPLDTLHGRWCPLVGLAVAIASAATSWAPSIARHPLVRIVLAGCVTLGLLGFASLAFHDLGTMGVHMHGAINWVVLGWFIASGIVAQLVIVDCRPRDVYFGLAIMFSAIAPFLRNTGHSTVAERILGMWIVALLPLLCAAVTRALHRRFTKERPAEVPDARVIP